MGIGRRIRQLRKALKYTQEEFGQKIGYGRNTVANYETERVNPPYSFIRLLCLQYNASEGWLMQGTGTMFSDPVNHFLDEIESLTGLDRDQRRIIEFYLSLPPEKRDELTQALFDLVRFVKHPES